MVKRTRLSKSAGPRWHSPKKRRLMKFEVVYRRRIYGPGSSMTALQSMYAESAAEAEDWVRVLKADRLNRDIEVVKLKKTEWF